MVAPLPCGKLQSTRGVGVKASAYRRAAARRATRRKAALAIVAVLRARPPPCRRQETARRPARLGRVVDARANRRAAGRRGRGLGANRLGHRRVARGPAHRHRPVHERRRATCVDSIRITSPVPADVQYVPHSASGPGSEVLFSVDDGRSFGAARRADARRARRRRARRRRVRLHARSLGAPCAARRGRHGNRAVPGGPALILDDVFGADGSLAERLPGFTYRAAQQQMAELVAEALDVQAPRRHRGRHGHRQDLRVLAAGAAARAPRHHLDRHAHVAGSIVRPRPTAARRRRRAADAGRAAQGPQQLSLLAPARRGGARRHARRADARRAACARRVGSDQRHGRPDRARRHGRRSRAASAGHFDRRQLLGTGTVRSSIAASFSRLADARKPPTS